MDGALFTGHELRSCTSWKTPTLPYLRNMSCISRKAGALSHHGGCAVYRARALLVHVKDDANAPVPQEYELYF